MAEDGETEEGRGQGGSDAAAHMALSAASRAKADAYLEKNGRLIDLQIEEMEREDQLRHWSLRVRHIGDVMKVGFELAVAFIVIAIAIFFGAAIWNAAHDNALVIEAFSVPPDMDQRGLTGQVVAAKLLDRLSSLQAQTESNRTPSSYANNWGDDIKVQIPDTGVSIGELNRYLRAWLGHETHISGEIYRTPTGIAVTTRVGSDASATFTGSEADFDRLVQQAAESVYGDTQLYRYAVYLMTSNRLPEAQAAYQKLVESGSPTDRAWAYIGLQNLAGLRGDTAGARDYLLDAIALRPDFPMAYINLAGADGNLQHDEAELSDQRKIVALDRDASDSDINPATFHGLVLQAQAAVAGDLGDYQQSIACLRQILAIPMFNNSVNQARQGIVDAFAFLHDGAQFRWAAKQFPPSKDENTLLNRHASVDLGALEMDDPKPLLRDVPAVEAFLEKIGPIGLEAERRQFRSPKAYANALTGDFVQAHALIAETPLDCASCLMYRARIDALQKNWAGSDYWFRRVTQFAPSNPLYWSQWGRMLLEKGDYDRAIATFKIAHEKGPHFADPLEGWGEALMGKNRSDLAVAKFEEAGKSAPNWGRLHLKWGEAFFYTGDKAGAQKQFDAASTLDLSPAEAAELHRYSNRDH
ncbi:MAG TPA: tetratricopeptide repeat protein [Rhizomicrobium sp.]